MDIKFLTLYMYIELLFKFKLDLKFFITLFINVYIHKFTRENFLKKKNILLYPFLLDWNGMDFVSPDHPISEAFNMVLF